MKATRDIAIHKGRKYAEKTTNGRGAAGRTMPHRAREIQRIAVKRNNFPKDGNFVAGLWAQAVPGDHPAGLDKRQDLGQGEDLLGRRQIGALQANV
jgi:hypothetical protein